MKQQLSSWAVGKSRGVKHWASFPILNSVKNAKIKRQLLKRTGHRSGQGESLNIFVLEECLIVLIDIVLIDIVLILSGISR